MLANLELLADELDGEQREAARVGACAPRSGCAGWSPTCCCSRAPTPGACAAATPDRPRPRSSIEAAAELEPLADDHELTVDAAPGRRRRARATSCTALALNLIENAIRHTPAGHARPGAASSAEDGEVGARGRGRRARASRRSCATAVFERFVRGGGDRGGSSGLGLAIVRAVAEAHGGTVGFEDAERAGARFVVRLPPRAGAGARAARQRRVSAYVSAHALQESSGRAPALSDHGQRAIRVSPPATSSRGDVAVARAAQQPGVEGTRLRARAPKGVSGLRR